MLVSTYSHPREEAEAEAEKETTGMDYAFVVPTYTARYGISSED